MDYEYKVKKTVRPETKKTRKTISILLSVSVIVYTYAKVEGLRHMWRETVILACQFLLLYDHFRSLRIEEEGNCS